MQGIGYIFTNISSELSYNVHVSLIQGVLVDALDCEFNKKNNSLFLYPFFNFFLY